VVQEHDAQFSARMAPRRARTSGVWKALVDAPKQPPAPARKPLSDRRALLLGRPGRFVLSVTPLCVAFALGEWFAGSGVSSFAGIQSFLGVIVVSMLAGLYPVLLLASSRRKGDYVPGTRFRAFGRLPVLAAIYVLFLAVLVLHGAVIWSDPAERAGALGAALGMLALPVVLMRGGAFARRVTVELRDDSRSGEAEYALRAGELPVSAAVMLDYADGEQRPEGTAGGIPALASLRRALFALRAEEEPRPDQVKVWVHRVTPEGESESLPAIARVGAGGQVEAADLSLSRGEAVFPFAHAELEVEIAFGDSAAKQVDAGSSGTARGG
jgi:hypothetical protein